MGEIADMEIAREMQEEAEAQRAVEATQTVAFEPEKSFDPRPYITTIKGQNYLQVAHRIAWFRSVYPEGRINVEHVMLDREWAVFKSTVTAVREGVVTGMAEAYGSCGIGEFGSYVEKAGTKATGRALAALGFGTIESLEFGDADDDLSMLADSPVASRGPQPMRQQPTSRPQGGQQQPSRPQGGPQRGNPPSDKQWGLFNRLVKQFNLNGQAVAQGAAGYPLDNLTSSGMSKCIDALKKIEDGAMEVPTGWFLHDEEQAQPQSMPSQPPHPGDGSLDKARAIETWAKNIRAATSTSRLDMIWETLEGNGLSTIPELVDEMNRRSQELGG